MTPTLTTASRYSRPWSCGHRHCARLANREIACRGCLHVVVRVDHSSVRYEAPAKELEVLSEILDEAVDESVAELLDVAAA